MTANEVSHLAFFLSIDFLNELEDGRETLDLNRLRTQDLYFLKHVNRIY